MHKNYEAAKENCKGSRQLSIRKYSRTQMKDCRGIKERYVTEKDRLQKKRRVKLCSQKSAKMAG